MLGIPLYIVITYNVLQRLGFQGPKNKGVLGARTL